MQTIPASVGSFEIVEQLARTEMSEVYRGTSESYGAGVIKVLHRDRCHDPVARARFAREIAVHQQLPDLWVPPVLEVGLEAEPPYFVTRDLGVPNLYQQVRTTGPLDERALWRLGLELAEFLTFIHAQDIVDRDLKPSNLALTAEYGLQVFDFGITKRGGDPQLTQSGIVVGSLDWMAPEALRGEVTSAGDVFSWGLTVAYAGTGRNPFGSASSPQARLQQLKGAPDLDGLPKTIRSAVAAALATEPRQRPDAGQLLSLLLSRGARRGDTRDIALDETASLTATEPAPTQPASATEPAMTWPSLVRQVIADRDRLQGELDVLRVEVELYETWINGLLAEVDDKKRLERERVQLREQLLDAKVAQQRAEMRVTEAEAAQRTAEAGRRQAEQATRSTHRRGRARVWVERVLLVLLVAPVVLALLLGATYSALPESWASKQLVNGWLVQAGLPPHQLRRFDPSTHHSVFDPLLPAGPRSRRATAAAAAWNRLEDAQDRAGVSQNPALTSAVDAYGVAVFVPQQRGRLARAERHLVRELARSGRAARQAEVRRAADATAVATARLFGWQAGSRTWCRAGLTPSRCQKR